MKKGISLFLTTIMLLTLFVPISYGAGSAKISVEATIGGNKRTYTIDVRVQ